MPLAITRQMPYVFARVGAAKGHFLIDFATIESSLDPCGFLPGARPRPAPGTADQFDGFDFYGVWGRAKFHLRVYDIEGAVPQAGIIGTDFLARHVYTLDYQEGALYRADAASFCGDEHLRAGGFAPVTSQGYYEADLEKMRAGFPRVPTVPVRVGKVTAIAQLDTGFDDALYRHSVNINPALFQALTAAGVKLEKIADGVALSTCVANEVEKVIPHRIASDHAFEIVAEDGSAAVAARDAVLHLKESPAAVRVCGGIGTWEVPAAQLGASFFVDAGRVVFDPFKARVWFGPKEERK